MTTSMTGSLALGSAKVTPKLELLQGLLTVGAKINPS